MSEIFAPGSVAGPAGPTGAAGSQGSVTALASSSLPSFVGVNLFDLSKITPGLAPSGSDGTLISAGGGSTNCTALIYCPGATSMVSDLPVDGGNWSGEAVCLYDANGGFISAIPTSEYTGHTPIANTIANGFAWALPGTQVYVRFGYVPSFINTNGWVATEAKGRVYATITGTATLPGTYAPPGLATESSLNASITAATANLTPMLATFEQAVLSGPTGGSRNLFDYTKAVPNMLVNSDGSISTTTNSTLSTVFCPGATSFITNLPIQAVPYNGTPHICVYDANDNVIEDITGSILALPLGNNQTLPTQVYPLPGTQTYMKFSWTPNAYGNPYPNKMQDFVFYAGTTASPIPSSLNSFFWSQPFGTNAPINIKTATQLGAAADRSYDAAPVLNAFLATASATNPIKLILDGVFLLSTGLVIASAGYTTIEGIGSGSGIVIIGGSTGSVTINSAGPGAFNVTPPTRTATNIILRNFSVSLNGGTNACMFISNCSFVLAENLYFPAASTSTDDFMLTIGNASNVFVRGCSFISGGTGHDGIHVNGLCEDITISDCYFATGDDAIALNAPEGYGGDISRVTVTNCRFNGSLTVLRIYTSLDPAAMATNNVHKVRNVVVSNCVGTQTGACFDLGIAGGGLTSTADVDQLQDFSVSNCTLSSPIFAYLLTPIGSLTFDNVRFIPTTTNALFQSYYDVGELVMRGFRILRNADGNAAPSSIMALNAGGVIDRFVLSDFAVIDEHGTSYTAIPLIIQNSGTLSKLVLENVDMTHVTALIDTWPTLVRGDGVLGTGVQIPDGNMDNNALYLSSTASGAPSIKVGGTAKRFTLA